MVFRGSSGPIPWGRAFVLHLCRPNEDNSIIWIGKVSFSRENQSSGKIGSFGWLPVYVICLFDWSTFDSWKLLGVK